MDGQKFDKLTRAFASGTDRRTLLKIFGGASVAAVAGVKLAAPSAVFAQGSEPGGECGSDGRLRRRFVLRSRCLLLREIPSRTSHRMRLRPLAPRIHAMAPQRFAVPMMSNASAGANGICVSDSVGCDPTGECSAFTDNVRGH